jgi:hypothetical protein
MGAPLTGSISASVHATTTVPPGSADLCFCVRKAWSLDMFSNLDARRACKMQVLCVRFCSRSVERIQEITHERPPRSAPRAGPQKDGLTSCRYPEATCPRLRYPRRRGIRPRPPLTATALRLLEAINITQKAGDGTLHTVTISYSAVNLVSLTRFGRRGAISLCRPMASSESKA